MNTLWYSWVLSTSKSSNLARDTPDKGFSRHPCKNDCKTSMTMVRIPVIPSKFGIISNAFLVETWFFYLLGGFYKHFIGFQDLLWQIYLLPISLVIKWNLESLLLSSSINWTPHHPITTIHHLKQHIFHVSKHFSVGATIWIIKSVTIFYLLFGNYGLQEDSYNLPSTPTMVKIDSNILDDGLLLISGLFQSSPICLMAGYDL